MTISEASEKAIPFGDAFIRVPFFSLVYRVLTRVFVVRTARHCLHWARRAAPLPLSHSAARPDGSNIAGTCRSVLSTHFSRRGRVARLRRVSKSINRISYVDTLSPRSIISYAIRGITRNRNYDIRDIAGAGSSLRHGTLLLAPHAHFRAILTCSSWRLAR